MKKKAILSTLLTSLAALCITCTAAFASQAVVDDYTYQYEHQSRFGDAIVVDGIDVSFYQQNVDWGAVKRHGIDYVFIRIGTTATDQFKIVKDSYFEDHYAKAKEAGLMVGVYYFSAATTLAEAEAEANNVITWLGGRDLDLPVVFDYEESDRVIPGTIDMTSNALCFLNYMDNHSDYEVMFYSYRYLMDPAWAGSAFTMDLIDSKYPVWIAQYSTDNSYSRPFRFWQYADDGSVAGISGKTDCNFWYFNEADYPAAGGRTAISNASAKLSKKNYLYDGQVKNPSVTVTYAGRTLAEGTDYKVHYIKNAKAGDAYVLLRGLGAFDGYKKVKFGIKTPLTAANKPTGIKATLRGAKNQGFDDIKVTWNEMTNATGYRVYYKKASASAYKFYKKIGSGDTTTATIKNLAKGTKYNVKVIAYGMNGSKSSFSAVKSVTTLKQVKQNKVKKYSSKKVKISWVNINGETGYQISRSTKKSGTNVVAIVKSTKAKSKVLTVPKKGKTYYYKVRAYKVVDGVKVCGPWSKVYSKKL